MKRTILILILAAMLLSMSGCGGAAASAPKTASAPAAEPAEAPAVETDGGTSILLQGDTAQIRGGGAKAQGGTVTISAVGTYTVSGSLDEGQLLVDTGEDALKVTLILDGARIHNGSGPAIWIKQAKDVHLQLVGENQLSSGTKADLAAFDDTASGAALFTEDDLDIEGEGSLEILGYLNNGITCKDDLDINSGTLTVLAANNGIRGNESVEIKGGSIHVTAGNDGVKATSTKKEGKGFVELSGGSLTVVSQGDGISAASDLSLSGGSAALYTGKQGLQAEGLLKLGECELLVLCDSKNQAEPAESAIPYVFASLKGDEGSTVRIGETEFKAENDYKAVLYASSALKAGESVDLSNGRTSLKTTVK